MGAAGIGVLRHRSAGRVVAEAQLAVDSPVSACGSKVWKSEMNSKPNFFECAVLIGQMRLRLYLRAKVRLAGGTNESIV